MSSSHTNIDLVMHLRRQLMFLKNSAHFYDNGCVEEGIRIAVIIRVLFHDSGGTSLLKQMNQKNNLQLVTTAKFITQSDSENMDFVELLAGAIFGQSLEYDPLPENYSNIGCSEWWKQTVFIKKRTNYTREDIVLAAANRDGGAHVAPKPDAELKALRDGFWCKTEITADGTENTKPLINNHFRMLRRFAAELLASEDLLQLAN